VNEKGVVVAKYNALDDADIARLGHDLAPYIDKAKANRPKSNGPSPEGTRKPEKGASR
jgi:hypothetical protein